MKQDQQLFPDLFEGKVKQQWLFVLFFSHCKLNIVADLFAQFTTKPSQFRGLIVEGTISVVNG